MTAEYVSSRYSDDDFEIMSSDSSVLNDGATCGEDGSRTNTAIEGRDREDQYCGAREHKTASSDSAYFGASEAVYSSGRSNATLDVQCDTVSSVTTLPLCGKVVVVVERYTRTAKQVS